MWPSFGWSAPRLLFCALCASALLAAAVQGDDEVPSEKQCRPYIEKALKELEGGEANSGSDEDNEGSKEAAAVSNEQDDDGTPGDSGEDDQENADDQNEEDDSKADSDSKEGNDDSKEDNEDSKEDNEDSKEDNENSNEEDNDTASVEVADEPYTGEDSQEDDQDGDNSKAANEDDDDDNASEEKKEEDEESAQKSDDDSAEDVDKDESGENDNSKENDQSNDGDSNEDQADDDTTEAGDDHSGEDSTEQNQAIKKNVDNLQAAVDDEDDNSKEEAADDDQSDENSTEDSANTDGDDDTDDKDSDDQVKSKEDDKESDEEKEDKSEENDGDDSKEETPDSNEKSDENDGDDDSGDDDDSDEETEDIPEEDLLKEPGIPANLKSRDHIIQLLRLDDESSENEVVIERSADIILRDLKRIYENSIKPLEVLYKYRDLSNRHFGDPEIFSKPLLLLMGPWSGGKSSIVNYLTDVEFTEWALRTGAEPSPAYFNILMHGKEPEVLDGTQLAADWTFSGLQKFGQGLEERLRGLKYPSKLLEKINIVEIPGILEVRKQVSRVFPFNDACQWFIDRADIIFLVYDPSKLDVGPETEAILDQLKGRESQVRIVLNKADIVKPEELLRVQGALIWNISPLMSSAAPPALYATSLWSRPLASNAPARLLAAQERALLTDLRSAIDRRIDNKIASARRFAVRVRNHAKMVDCYLTTYYNHKTIFGNKKVIAEAIIEHPQNYHIYEGLSTLTNISRYDLPDPETYRDFFRLNPLYDFQPLTSTCTYFRGCPINRLDVAIAYDLPELVGKYKKMVESAVPQGMPKT